MKNNATQTKCERVIVNVRIRPFTDDEKRKDSSCPMEIIDQKRNVLSVKKEYDTKNFSYDKLFPISSNQQEIFESSPKAVVEGYNGTIFAYGQTGSGKTYTMVGGFENETYKGVIPRSFDYLFEQIEKDKEHKYNLMISFIQIYLETVQDLLEPKNKDIRIREDPEQGVYLEGVQWIKVTSTSDCANVFRFGEKNRVTESTRMNAHSSRSHAILIVRIEKNIMLSQEKIMELSKETNEHIKAERVMTKSMLFLVDLAGSERVKKTKAENMRLEEAKKINYSLLILGNCISSLTDSKSTHVSYRDSKLTRLLQESLGGNAKTCLIVTVSPSGYNTEETVSSLNFALRAMKVQNKPIINQSVDYQALSIKLQDDLDKLNDQYALLKIDFEKLLDENSKLKNGEAFIEMQRKSIVNSIHSETSAYNSSTNIESKSNAPFDKKKAKNIQSNNKQTEIKPEEEMKKLEMFYQEVLATKTAEYENILKEIDKILLEKENEIDALTNDNSLMKQKLKSQYESILDMQKEKKDLMKSVFDLTNRFNEEERLKKTNTITESNRKINKLNASIEALERNVIQLEQQNDSLSKLSMTSVNAFISKLDDEIKKLNETKAEFLQQKNNSVIKSSQNEIKIKIDNDGVDNLKTKLNTVTEEMKKIIKARISETLKTIKSKKEENKILLEEKTRLCHLITDYEKEIEMKTELQETIRNLDEDAFVNKDKTHCLCESMLSEINMKLSLRKSQRDKQCLIVFEEDKEALKQEVSLLKEQNIKLALRDNSNNANESNNQKDKVDQFVNEKEKEIEISLNTERAKYDQQLKLIIKGNNQLKQKQNELKEQLENELIKEKEKYSAIYNSNSKNEAIIIELIENKGKMINEMKAMSKELKTSKETIESKDKEIKNASEEIEKLNQETGDINNELLMKNEIVKSSINVNETFNKEMNTKISEYALKSKKNQNEINQLKESNTNLQSIISVSNEKIERLYRNICKTIQTVTLFEEEIKKINDQTSSSSQSFDLSSLTQLMDNDPLFEEDNDEEHHIPVKFSKQQESSASIEHKIDSLKDKFSITKDKIGLFISYAYSLAQSMKKNLDDNGTVKQYQIGKMHQFLTMLSLQDIALIPLAQKKIYSCTNKISLNSLFDLSNEVYSEIITKYYSNANEKDQEITHLNDRIEYFIKELDIIKKTNDEISKGSLSTKKIQNLKYENQIKLKNDELAKVNKRLDQHLKTINDNKKELMAMQKEINDCHSIIKQLQDKYDKQSRNIEKEQQYKVKEKLKLANKDLNTGKYLIKEFFGKASKFSFDLCRFCEKSND